MCLRWICQARRFQQGPEKYTARANSDDIVWFINNVVKDPVVVSGHSSGGLIAALVAATAPDMVRGLVIEDAPFFSTEPDRAPKTFAGHGFKDMHDFRQRRTESPAIR